MINTCYFSYTTNYQSSLKDPFFYTPGSNAASSFLTRETLHSTASPQSVLGPLNTGLLNTAEEGLFSSSEGLLLFYYLIFFKVLHKDLTAVPQTAVQYGLHHHFATTLNVS